MNDYEIIDFIEKKISETRGEEQEEWVRKHDIFTSRVFFKKYNKVERLKEVEIIRMSIIQEYGGSILSNKPWLIKNSTREERSKRISDALAISTLDAKEPLKEDMELYQKYIDGEMELDEVKEKLISKYTEEA